MRRSHLVDEDERGERTMRMVAVLVGLDALLLVMIGIVIGRCSMLF